MDCKRIRELITTDYIDSELDEKSTKEVKAHLIVCRECREFEELVRKAAVEPFKDLEDIKPPEYIWGRIKEKIQKEKIRQREGALTYIKNCLQSVIIARKPVFAAAALAVCVMCVIISAVFSDSQRRITDYLQEQGEFLSSLDMSAGNSFTTNHGGLDTSIEEYFS